MIQLPLSVLPVCLTSLTENKDWSQNPEVIDFQNLYLSESEQYFSATDLEARLKRFIQWALQQSYLKHYSQDTLLQILDCAWEAQKLLWKIR
ncbi:MAG TPA: hypothetical protein V6C78_13015 [Crinalium sp.]|jgi:hypothetical protein